ncbi:ATP-dependent DNA/RNA helicase DHX36 [Teleopsis dalmanni]|uniref:ATP-dependent DNA/RNA helicase DHX36 n=1 Tax=Teleopsis dalmanni TaxID=139649 RepID=UPI0018CEBE5A|nr:ATP-dependent DNA/RNA helicase DHX36 [Teleopsis dalmanni]
MSNRIKKEGFYYICPIVKITESFRKELNIVLDKFKAKSIELEEAHKLFQIKYDKHEHRHLKISYEKALIQNLTTQFNNFALNDKYNENYAQRLKLPVMKAANIIKEAVTTNNIILVLGDTGCGKSTQIPQIILDMYLENGKADECRIVCTQPRRIPAISIAQRVAAERCDKIGNSVGYQIRLQNISPRGPGSILYCTTGVLLHRMQMNFLLNDFNVVIIDEVHERGIEVDLLLGLLKRIIEIRKELKFILMSATVDEKCFIEYYKHCKVLRIEGTMHPVKSIYLEDILAELIAKGTSFKNFFNKDNFSDSHYRNMIMPHMNNIKKTHGQRVADILQYPDSEGCSSIKLIECLIYHICEQTDSGAILVFLPGIRIITDLGRILRNNKIYQNRIVVYYLHSTLSIAKQQLVFKIPEKGVRKIILSTSIAETSVTIEDIVYVIDSGRIKINEYDVSTNIANLRETWVSKSNVKQRRGRAGRLKAGYCYHLYTRARENTMPMQIPPEITRTQLQDAILRLKFFAIDNVKEFFYNLMDPPFAKAVDNGIELLKVIGCLDENEKLTPMGSCIATIPIEVQLAKMILYGAIFKCLDPVTTIAASFLYKSPFEEEERGNEVYYTKSKFAEDSCSDLILLHNIVRSMRKGIKLDEHAVNQAIMDDIIETKKQLTSSLSVSGFTKTSDSSEAELNINSNNLSIVRSVIAGALYPNIVLLLRTHSRGNKVYTSQELDTTEYKRVHFCKNSINSGRRSFMSNFFVYYKICGNRIDDSTMVSPNSLLLFKELGENIKISDNECTIIVRGSLKFTMEISTYKCLIKLRKMFNKIVEAKCLGVKMDNEEDILSACCRFLSSNEDELDES